LHRRTRATTDVVESELAHERVELEEERERLADTAGSAEDGNLGELSPREVSNYA
jgi:hypothetical protein